MNRSVALPYVSYVVDDVGNGRALGADEYAIVTNSSVLVGWQCGFELLFVAVNSYLVKTALDSPLDEHEAEELAIDYLREIDWFSHPDDVDADYVITPTLRE